MVWNKTNYVWLKKSFPFISSKWPNEEEEGGESGVWAGREYRKPTPMSCQAVWVLPLQMVTAALTSSMIYYSSKCILYYENL